ncbi:MSMEG_0570 family nitrogen starvation response protein [Promicromonospora sukumoe]|uniref:Putative repeat protein (TIGR04042 family) n=1 Tax=Promicromonospora sukumoe TaxID=88382 RepID=A0A7W3J8W2_9MICO|nr:MSMEG_0570 family nitrogen starvation response protein [Promicromonospora sukumoe]MBA8808427.1 putative repeat protein (TIGR04042 family) [Promicromonospora sukumoe]
MPEMTFDVRWPDGTTASCYSPSLVMHDHLQAGSRYPVADFVERSSRALQEASDRVRARYGMGCASAAQQEAEIRQTASAFDDAAEVEVLRMEPPLPGGAA